MDKQPYYGTANYQGSGYYIHYKGGMYCVLGLAIKEDTVDKEHTPEGGDAILGEVFVIYMPLSEGSLLPRLASMADGTASGKVDFWARSLEDFNALVQKDYHTYMRRFEKVEFESVTDRELIELVANAEPHTELPAEYRSSLGSGARAIYHRLIGLGVMEHPGDDTTLVAVFPIAKEACQKWLRENGEERGDSDPEQ